MILCIAEKPSVAKDIAEILGARSRKDGYWEGNGFWVSWTFGHLCTLKEPHDYKESWKYWKLEDLPIIPQSFGIKVVDDPGVQKQFKCIENLVANCTEVINCGDAGQEGELIQRWVLLKAKCDKPVRRLWISSLTEEAIKEGFQKLKDAKLYDNLYAAGSARAIGDWLLGINATRAFTTKFGRGKATLSIGRVQTPTLAMIVQRQKEINAFVSAEYWELKTTYRDTEFLCQIDRLTSEEKANKGLEYLKLHEFEVTSFEQKEGKEGNPRLFDLTSLQVEGNKKYGFSADETLKLVQSLYEKKNRYLSPCRYHLFVRRHPSKSGGNSAWNAVLLKVYSTLVATAHSEIKNGFRRQKSNRSPRDYPDWCQSERNYASRTTGV